MRHAAIPLTLVVAAFAAAPAGAQTPAPQPTGVPVTTPPPSDPTPPATPSPPARAPKGGRIALRFVRPLMVKGRPLALVGRPFLVRGVVTRFAPGQHVRVTGYRNGKLFLRRRVAIHGDGHGHGAFRFWVRPHGTGRIGLRAVHEATSRQVRIVSKPLRLHAYSPEVGYGSRSPVVSLVQSRLARLHYFVWRSGRFDAATGWALLAYRKVNGLARAEALGRYVLHRLIAGRGAFRPRYPSHGRHVEGDLTHQVLALVEPGGRVHRVYHISSGKPSTPTVLGHFRFYLRGPGYNAEGMYYSSYFIRGYAVHGYHSVPAYPASHGCLRVPIPEAYGIYRWIRMGMPIDVYYR